MKDWERALVGLDASVRDALQVIDSAAMQIALVVDSSRVLRGTVTDGDVRRAMLRGISLEESVSKVMNAKPTIGMLGESREAHLKKMRQKDLHHLPLVDNEQRLIGCESIEDFIEPVSRDNWVVLMAGGLGTRLGELTSDRPKPLISVGERPMLETILQEFVLNGFKRFFISVNYKAEMIQEYFGDGSKWGVSIEYLCEETKLGTAGALSLLPSKPKDPVLVMNGDVLTKVNFQHLLKFHVENKAAATMCIRPYEFQVPFGVVAVEKQSIVAINEKPIHQFYVNAGIYVLSPDVLELVPAQTATDMPQLFQSLLEKKKKTIAFPIREYWVDVGQVADLKRANDEFSDIFQKK